MTLTDAGLLYQTDKASHHFYTGIYDLILRGNKPTSLLEIGIQFGNSLRMWKEAFPYADIVGIDSVDNNVICEGSNYEIIIADAYKQETIDKLFPRYQEFDLIIDDGSHHPNDQHFVVVNYSKILSRAGILIIEDVPDVATVELLKIGLPEGFQYTAIEMVEGKSLVDSRLFIVYR